MVALWQRGNWQGGPDKKERERVTGSLTFCETSSALKVFPGHV